MSKFTFKYFFSICFLNFLVSISANAQNINFLKIDNRPVETRVDELIAKLTLEEKVSLLGYQSKAVERLGIPAYNWWNEALHGVARAGKATVFPQAIAMAATFNDSLIFKVADAISTEARAKYNLAKSNNNQSQYLGLTFWSPNVNIFRDPRWGRGQETYGEDPFLTASMGTAFVKGMQGNNPKYLKTAACAKHFAVHSGPESLRHSFNAIVDEKDLRETYLYAFKKLVDVNVESVMCAYNRLNDEPCCTNNNLLTGILRNEWGFKGHVVTDCWALDDVYKGHAYLKSSVEVAAAALKAGVNLDCSGLLQTDLLAAVKQGLITENEIDNGLKPIIKTQFKLGFYDDFKSNPYSKIDQSQINSQSHIALARKVAQQSMVLLKNDKYILPFKKNQFQSLMVIGPNAASLGALMGNYHGVSGNMVTFLEGITHAVGGGVAVQYEQGSNYTDTTRFGGVWAAGNCDATIAIIGLTPVLEGEEHDAFLSNSGGDKADLNLPKPHIELLKRLKENNKNKPLIAVVTAGSDIDISQVSQYADAVILAWYPGEQGGNALADIIFGDVSPSGKLPITFYNSLKDLPDYTNYALKGRTYRYFKGKVQHPFGFGLSYTSFGYRWLVKPESNYSINDSISVSIKIQNTGSFSGDEVLQAYIKYPDIDRMPIKELKAFKRVNVNIGSSTDVQLKIPVKELQKWALDENIFKLYKGKYQLIIGNSATNEALLADFEIR